MEISKEIGGNFTILENDSSDCFLEDSSTYFFSSGRGAIRAAIETSGVAGKRVALPYFTCHSVIEPFVQAKCEIVFFSVDNDLSVSMEYILNFCHLNQPKLLFYHDYFGNTQEDVWSIVFEKYGGEMTIVNDQTHSFFSTGHQVNAHYSLMSMRKWGGVSEGGRLSVWTKQPADVKLYDRPEDDIRLDLFVQASKLKLAYLHDELKVNKKDFLDLYYKSEDFFNAESKVMAIDQMALKSWIQLSKTNFIEKRRSNARTLVENWQPKWSSWSSALMTQFENETPLFFPILLKVSRVEFQKYLAQHSIYAPIIWPKSELIKNSQNDTLYNQLICLPIDQRYNSKDMLRIIEVVDKYCSNYLN